MTELALEIYGPPPKLSEVVPTEPYLLVLETPVADGWLPVAYVANRKDPEQVRRIVESYVMDAQRACKFSDTTRIRVRQGLKKVIGICSLPPPCGLNSFTWSSIDEQYLPPHKNQLELL